MDIKHSVSFTCNCGKAETWITEGETTPPCPYCGRKYVGVYDPGELTIVAKEVDG